MKVTQKARVSRGYSDRTIKILWGRAAGRCALPDCRIDVLVEATDHDPIVVVGDIAHIEGAAPHSARHNPGLTKAARDDYGNLILLCKVCHAKLDAQKHTNSKEKIRAIRDAHEAWVRENLPERGRSRVGWRVLILQGAHRIELPAALDALAPDYEEGPTSVLTVNDENSWEITSQMLTEGAKKVLASSDDAFTTRIAIFPLARVSACIGFGYLLTNRPMTRAYQYHRDARSWAWNPHVPEAQMPRVLEWPEPLAASSCSIAAVAVCFDLSGRVPESSLSGAGRDFGAIVRVALPAPSTTWLQSEKQLVEFAALTRDTFERISSVFPRANSWHIFYAGPAPGAVAVGQQLNPTMSPPVQLYEYQKGESPEHSPSLVLRHGRLATR